MSDVLQCDGLYLTDVAKKEKKKTRKEGGKKGRALEYSKLPAEQL